MNLPALLALSASSIPRVELQRGGWNALAKSGDLHVLGYQLVLWFHVRSGDQLWEYVPRPTSTAAPLPRLTADTYERQVAIHRALGLHTVRRGDEWRPLAPGQGSLDFGRECGV